MNTITKRFLRARIYSLVHPQEKAVDFIEKFEAIISDYENIDCSIPLSETEKRGAFYKAVSGTVPEIRSID